LRPISKVMRCVASHGCVWVDRGEQFVQTLLTLDGWNGDPVPAIVGAATTRIVDLAFPLSIDIA